MQLIDYIKVYDFEGDGLLEFLNQRTKWKHSQDNDFEKTVGVFDYCKVDNSIQDYGKLWSMLLTGQLQSINEYIKDFPKSEFSGGSAFYFRKYSINGHTYEDCYYDPTVSKQCNFIMNLNDDYSGGELKINDEIYRLKKNQLIIFPRNFMYRWSHQPVVSGEKYTIESFIV